MTRPTQPLVIRTSDPATTEVLNPEILGGRGVLFVPPEVSFVPLAWDPPAQCGRTYRHLPHGTTAGDCAGLDGTEVTRPVPGLLSALHRAITAAREARRG